MVFSECVFVAVGIQHAMRVRRVVIFNLLGFHNIFPHCLINATIFEKKKRAVQHKMCVLVFSTNFIQKIYHSKENLTRYDEKRVLVFI